MDVSHQPCTKPDYVNQANVRYDAANTLLLDDDNDAVMMEWERPLMEAHASFLAGNASRGDDSTKDCNKRVLNIGFGLGIVDTAIQAYNPSLHVIIEAHPTVYKKMIDDGWDKKDNVKICFGRWQDELPKLIAEGLLFDGIFYDTYGEVSIVCSIVYIKFSHDKFQRYSIVSISLILRISMVSNILFLSIQTFSALICACLFSTICAELVVTSLAKPNGVYSFL